MKFSKYIKQRRHINEEVDPFSNEVYDRLQNIFVQRTNQFYDIITEKKYTKINDLYSVNSLMHNAELYSTYAFLANLSLREKNLRSLVKKVYAKAKTKDDEFCENCISTINYCLEEITEHADVLTYAR